MTEEKKGPKMTKNKPLEPVKLRKGYLCREPRVLNCYIQFDRPCSAWCPQWSILEGDDKIEVILFCTGRKFVFRRKDNEWVECQSASRRRSV